MGQPDKTIADNINEVLPLLLAKVKEESFVDATKATDEQAFGLMLANYFHVDGHFVLKAAVVGLEHCNFRVEARVMSAFIPKG